MADPKPPAEPPPGPPPGDEDEVRFLDDLDSIPPPPNEGEPADEVVALDEDAEEGAGRAEDLGPEATPGDPQILVDEVMDAAAPSTPPRVALLDPRLVVYHTPLAPISEQYRQLRANLVSFNPRNSPKSIVVASTMRGEGKSLSVVNLALCLRELKGVKVCVLDCDLRRPSIHKLVGIEREMGVADMLVEDNLSLRAVLKDVGIPNLSFLTAGRLVANPAEVLASGRIRTLLDLLKSQFTYILIDTPPCLVAADAGLVAGGTDGVLLVVRLDDTPKKFVQKSVEVVRASGGQILGCFLTGARPGREAQKLYAYWVDPAPVR